MKFTKEYFDKYFEYDHDSGCLLWKVLLPRARNKIGGIAGVIDREGYVLVSLGKTAHRAHRIIWVMITGCEPQQIDHINGNRSDNRFENLRSVTNQENSRNQRLRRTNSSGHAGVCWHKKFGKWISQIRVDGRYRYLGLFSDKDLAIKARKEAEAKYGFHENHGSERDGYHHG